MDISNSTNYPLVLVHGTGFRDRKHFGYWGRIPKILGKEGYSVFFGNQDSWGSIEENAKTLKVSIENIISQTNCKKVNLIAHSKGGLECRYLISSLNMGDKIASLTLISTPNHGSKTMSKLWKLPKTLFKIAAFFSNLFFRMMGDKKPDFFKTCSQFTMEYSEVFNAENPDFEGIYYQSYAVAMKNIFSDIFMFLPHLVVLIIEGENDGLVTTSSAAWTNFKGVMRGVTNRGISHADAVDIRRRRFTNKKREPYISDITDFYFKIAQDLKDMGF